MRLPILFIDGKTIDAVILVFGLALIVGGIVETWHGNAGRGFLLLTGGLMAIWVLTK